VHGRGHNLYKVLCWERPKKRNLSKDRGVDERMDQNLCYADCVVACEADSRGSGQGSVASSCEHGDELSGPSAMELVELTIRLARIMMQ
jgi:hypothetical protein